MDNILSRIGCKFLAGAAVFLLIWGNGASVFARGSSSSAGIDVGILMPETHVERWVRDGASLKEDVEAKGLKAEVAYGDADQGKQNQQIEDFITKGAKVLIVGSVNEGAAEAVSKASEEGVQVIAYDRLITNSDKYDYYITFDNFKVGEFQGQGIVNALNLDSTSGPYNIALFAGAPTDNNARYFFDGAMSVLKPYIDSGKIVLSGPAPLSSDDPTWSQVTTENWMAERAQSRMENLLSGALLNVSLSAVLAPNDTLGRAIITALEQDSKYANSLPVVTGQDAEALSVNWIAKGRQTMTVFKDTRALAAGAANLAVALLQGNTPSISGARVDNTTYNTGLKTVTSYLLEPVNVTADNYKQVLIDSGYYTAADIGN